MKKAYRVGTTVYVIIFKDNKWIFDGSYMTIDEVINLRTGETFYVKYYEEYENSSMIINANDCFISPERARHECELRNRPFIIGAL